MSASHPAPTTAAPTAVDVAVIGGGQAGLAAGFHLQRLARDVERGRAAGPAPSFVILDAAGEAGGAWRHFWDSLELFSPAEHSSLPGHRMPALPDASATESGNPDALHVVDYLADYEQRYSLPVRRTARVSTVTRDASAAEEPPFTLFLEDGSRLTAGAVVSATGTFTRPYLPAVPGAAEFAGRRLHSAAYRRPEDFTDQRVLVVGGGNSGPQVAADLLDHAAEVTWACRRPPRFMPDDVDGRVLFQAASARVLGRDGPSVGELGDIVAVPPVRRARDERGLHAVPMVSRLTRRGAAWDDDAGLEHGWAADSAAAAEVRGTDRTFDAMVWSTGFHAELRHLRQLDLSTTGAGVPRTRSDLPTASTDVPGLYLLGYGDWCGPASATLVGVGVWARNTVEDVAARLAEG